MTRLSHSLRLILINMMFFSSTVLPQSEIDVTEAVVVGLDSTNEKKTFINGYTFAYYTPETQFAFGAGGILVFYTDDKLKTSPSKIALGGYYSTTREYKITLISVLYFDENKFYAELPFSIGHFVDKFWGIGNQTIETGNEPYTRDQIAVMLKAQAPPFWFVADRTGLIVDYDKTTMDDKKDNEILINDMVTGSNGGELVGFGSDLLWDNRDNIFFPNRGAYQYLKFIVYTVLSDYQFYIMELELKHFTAFSPDHVLAANFYFEAAGG